MTRRLGDGVVVMEVMPFELSTEPLLYDSTCERIGV